MKLFNYICGQPVSGGPAPLIYNPVKKWLIILSILHIILSMLFYGVFLFPKLSDLKCPELIDTLFNFSISVGVSNVMAPYYSIISCREWGTEYEWGIVALVSMIMSIIDLCSSSFGIYVLYTIITNVFIGTETVHAECHSIKSILYFGANTFLIALHLIVAIVCSVVFYLLMTGIDKQLEIIKRTV